MDNLITYIVNEITYEGPNGCLLSQLWSFISNYTEKHNQANSVLDDALRSLIWKYLLQEDSVLVKKRDQSSLFDKTSSHVSNYANLIGKDHDTQVLIAEERRWIILTGHGVDHTKVSPLAFAILECATYGRSQGMPQTKIAAMTGQEPRSFPSRVKALVHAGLIRKEKCIADGAKTFRLTHTKFAPPKAVTKQLIDTARVECGIIEKLGVAPDHTLPYREVRDSLGYEGPKWYRVFAAKIREWEEERLVLRYFIEGGKKQIRIKYLRLGIPFENALHTILERQRRGYTQAILSDSEDERDLGEDDLEDDLDNVNDHIKVLYDDVIREFPIEVQLFNFIAASGTETDIIQRLNFNFNRRSVGQTLERMTFDPKKPPIPQCADRVLFREIDGHGKTSFYRYVVAEHHANYRKRIGLDSKGAGDLPSVVGEFRIPPISLLPPQEPVRTMDHELKVKSVRGRPRKTVKALDVSKDSHPRSDGLETVKKKGRPRKHLESEQGDAFLQSRKRVLAKNSEKMLPLRKRLKVGSKEIVEHSGVDPDIQTSQNTQNLEKQGPVAERRKAGENPTTESKTGMLKSYLIDSSEIVNSRDSTCHKADNLMSRVIERSRIKSLSKCYSSSEAESLTLPGLQIPFTSASGDPYSAMVSDSVQCLGHVDNCCDSQFQSSQDFRNNSAQNQSTDGFVSNSYTSVTQQQLQTDHFSELPNLSFSTNGSLNATAMKEDSIADISFVASRAAANPVSIDPALMMDDPAPFLEICNEPVVDITENTGLVKSCNPRSNKLRHSVQMIHRQQTIKEILDSQSGLVEGGQNLEQLYNANLASKTTSGKPLTIDRRTLRSTIAAMVNARKINEIKLSLTDAKGCEVKTNLIIDSKYDALGPEVSAFQENLRDLYRRRRLLIKPMKKIQCTTQEAVAQLSRRLQKRAEATDERANQATRGCHLDSEAQIRARKLVAEQMRTLEQRQKAAEEETQQSRFLLSKIDTINHKIKHTHSEKLEEPLIPGQISFKQDEYQNLLDLAFAPVPISSRPSGEMEAKGPKVRKRRMPMLLASDVVSPVNRVPSRRAYQDEAQEEAILDMNDPSVLDLNEIYTNVPLPRRRHVYDDEENRLIIRLVIAARCLFQSHIIKWDIVKRAIPARERNQVKVRWSNLRNQPLWRTYTAQQAKLFPAAYRKGLQEGIFVSPNLEDEESIDLLPYISYLEELEAEGLEDELDDQLSVLPETMEILKTHFDITKISATESWQDKYDALLPYSHRKQCFVDHAFYMAIDPEIEPSVDDRDVQRKIKSILATPQHIYEKDLAAKILEGHTTHDVQDAIDALCLRRTAVRMKANSGRIVPGRNFQLSEQFFISLIPQWNLKLSTLSNFQRLILEAFKKGRASIPFSPLSNDSTVASILNLVASRKIRIQPAEEFFENMDAADSGYQRYDREQHDFGVVIKRGESYISDEGMSQDQSKVQEDHHYVWTNLAKERIPAMWKKVDDRVISLVVGHPGISKARIANQVSVSLDGAELGRILQGMLEQNRISSRVISNNSYYFSTEFWPWAHDRMRNATYFHIPIVSQNLDDESQVESILNFLLENIIEGAPVKFRGVVA
ncbi:Transcription factor tau subunit sfc3 [Neolecta irregularis DAH-3]|uniref:Transcription factor tau subunit sfc3 n=1 Tax=Neolecta irregularis (strain DAH-3) TaxID=1198029 RepID=A0A1U7LUT8_NEOID|nr:Transcription factor tau subunit sfc3 [Neolecta irregularis DAH-3]|eukprot:OLL26445.1 Transcription factor tau subunit sfc3 [Neolecta irregularis DAH-3]